MIHTAAVSHCKGDEGCIEIERKTTSLQKDNMNAMALVRDVPYLDDVIFYFGCFTLLKAALYAFSVIARVLYTGPNVKSRYPKNAYAVITGGNRGIGRGYAEEFARQGLNLLLIARTLKSNDPSKKGETLMDAKEELTNKYGVDVRIHQADISMNDRGTWDEITEQLHDINVAVLVNNAGISYESAMYFTEVDTNRIDVLIGLNVMALTRMTRIVLDQWEENNEKGDIVNITSYAGVNPAGDPLYAVYSGTKAYVQFFSRSLHYELRSKGINVECHVPHFVTSRMSRIRRSSIMVPSEKAWAKAAVQNIGRPFAGPLITPYWFHAFCEFVIDSLPNMFIVNFLLSHHHAVRRKWLKKKQKQN